MTLKILFITLFIVIIVRKTLNNNKIYTIRTAKKYKDFKGISQCAYEVYGKSYPYTYIYDTEKIKLFNKEKRLVSFIAKNKGRIIGHVALNTDKNSQDICEMCTAFVNPKFRGQGILNDLSNRALNKCKTHGFNVAYVEAVCTHTYSQKGAKKLGLNECAIMLSKVEPLNFKTLNEEKNDRETLVKCFIYSKEPKEKQFFLGKKHREIVEEIYNSLGVQVTFNDNYEKSKIYSLKSVIDVEHTQGGSAIISIVQVGADICKVVTCKLKELIRNGTKSILLTMRLNNMSTVYICEKFEDNGFIFCGVEPRYLDEDLIVLQYVVENVDFNCVKLSSPQGKNLLKYIKNEFYEESERKEANEF